MPHKYLPRARAGADVDKGFHPWAAALLTVLLPLAIGLLGYTLLMTVAIDNSTGYAVSFNGVRTAIAQMLEKDLATDRVQDVLTELRDPSPGTDPNLKEQRKNDRAARLKSVAARLTGDRARLAESLTSLALQSHPGLEQAVNDAKDAATRRLQMANIVAKRLDAQAVRDKAETWVAEALDERSRAVLVATVAPTADPKPGEVALKPEQVAARSVAGAVSLDALTRSVSAAIALPFNVFDTRPGESAWASDVGARLAWAIVATLFVSTFGLVLFTSVLQVRRIDLPHRHVYLAVTAVVAVLAGLATRQAFSPSSGITPLHLAFKDYAQLFGVGILKWADIFNVLRGIGVVFLIAGSVATFLVTMQSEEELKEQLRGFKALFNAGAVFLMAGTFEVYAGLRWPIVFADDATRTTLQSAAAAYAASIGAGFTVVMLATYFATTFILRQQAAKEKIKHFESAFKEFGFSDLTSQQVMRFAQALAPLLPGVFTLTMS